MKHMLDLKFLKIALKDYRVATLTPTSHFVVERVMAELRPQDRFFVEYGPGNGVMTKALLAGLPDDGKVVAIEINTDFFGELKKINDSRLKLVNGDVANATRDFAALGLPRVDVVVSSIPLSYLKPRVRKEIIQNTYLALCPGGRFLVYQHSPFVYPLLKKTFSSVKVGFELRDFLPKFIMVAEKNIKNSDL